MELDEKREKMARAVLEEALEQLSNRLLDGFDERHNDTYGLSDLDEAILRHALADAEFVAYDDEQDLEQAQYDVGKWLRLDVSDLNVAQRPDDPKEA